MASVLLSAAGSAIGGGIGGSLLGISAGALGQAIGATAGALIDQTILGAGAAAVEVGRARSLRLQASTEGAPIAQVFGRMRVAGQIIWATRFLETVRDGSRGGKATSGQSIREFSYSISFAVSLCEGPIDRIGRIWADGKLFSTESVNFRVHRGDEAQLPDPKIEAVEGVAPAYRGLAYVVFEDLPLGAFGNRIPQLSFEVYRSIPRSPSIANDDEIGSPVRDLVRAVALSPGTGEFSLDPEPIQLLLPGGQSRYINVNNGVGQPDLNVSLDQLRDELQGCSAVSLIVSWFGTDLRMGRCLVEPRIEERGRVTRPDTWRVSNLSTSTASVVSRDALGRPNFGGTPSDISIIRCIRALRARGFKVMLYPFLLMDIPAENDLEDPYTGASFQPAFPWRGRITLENAPGRIGSADQTFAAKEEVDRFFGTATADNYLILNDGVRYTGPDEWAWRRFVLHLSALGAAAGGVDAICVGSELRGLTTVRSSRTAYPAVDQLIQLTHEVRVLLPSAKLGYAADWSEYFGHQPVDGSGDMIFHLDPLWSNDNIDFVGIDDYTPLSDWRYGSQNTDGTARHQSIYSLDYLKSNVEGGEYFDYFYLNEEARNAQIRSPISDDAHGEPWIFRPKDLRSWWSKAHHNRISGVRNVSVTAWVPRSKPIWLTETGCPCVDLGANQPNLFIDGKSSESALPVGSRGARDDEMQRRFLQAKLSYWTSAENNPVSPIYGGQMLPVDRIFIWTWDARPWPDFPLREAVWADGPAHRLGHWITGRISAGSLAELVAAICEQCGVNDIDVSRLHGAVDGYVIDQLGTGREMLQPLMQAYGFDAFEAGGRVVFRMRSNQTVVPLVTHRFVLRDGGPIERTRQSVGVSPDIVRLSYVLGEADYRVAAVEARLPIGGKSRVAESSLNLSMSASTAQSLTDRWLSEAWRSKDLATFALPASRQDVEPGDVVAIEGASDLELYRIDRIADAAERTVSAVRVDPVIYLPKPSPERVIEPSSVVPSGPMEFVFLDLPIAEGQGTDHRPRIAVSAQPWIGDAVLYKTATGAGFDEALRLKRPAILGWLIDPLPPASPNYLNRTSIVVSVPTGFLASAERLEVLNGANRLAIASKSGEWELLQFETAELVGPDRYRLTTLLRGLHGTEREAAAGADAG